jgi:hypothetical protein
MHTKKEKRKCSLQKVGRIFEKNNIKRPKIIKHFLMGREEAHFSIALSHFPIQLLFPLSPCRGGPRSLPYQIPPAATPSLIPTFLFSVYFMTEDGGAPFLIGTRNYARSNVPLSTHPTTPLLVDLNLCVLNYSS